MTLTKTWFCPPETDFLFRLISSPCLVTVPGVFSDLLIVDMFLSLVHRTNGRRRWSGTVYYPKLFVNVLFTYLMRNLWVDTFVFKYTSGKFMERLCLSKPVIICLEIPSG